MHQKHGVEGLTIANPLYISEVKKNFPDLEISASVLDDIDCAHKAKMYSELGADIITPDGDVNRDLETLRKMKKAANAEFKLMLNDGCLYKCPFRRFHFNYISHKSVELGPVEQDIFTEKCGLVSLQDRSQILKSGWIRPEDMEHYTDITHFFKIVGRTHPKSMVIRTVRAYMNQIWEGDLLDIVSGSLYGIGIDFGAHLDNVSLTQAHFFEKITSCDRNCESCGFCAELAGKLVSFKVVTRGKLEDLGLKDLCDNLEREGKLID
jgi:collagenase-like PrtC family protease